jgi:hypothetical protein
LFEPGGDSLTPTSPAASAIIFWPALPPAGIPATPPAAPGAMAPWSIEANWPCESPVVAALAGAGGVAVAVDAIGGASAALISEMRAMTVCRLT